MELKFKVQTKIQKPAADVFQAVYDPAKLSGYFTNGGASAPLKEGTTVEWSFADDPAKEPIAFPVMVKKVVPDELIVLEWQGAKDHETSVEIKFESTGTDETMVTISETGWRENQDDLDRSYMNCMGWSQMVSALKGYLEYGINLRKGAYGGIHDPEEFKTAKS